MKTEMNALVIVDMQNDFVEGGALAVPGGRELIPVIDHLARRFDLVVATQDWHPPNHGSFAANHPGKKVGEVIELGGLPQVMWPVHCVQNTPGAKLLGAWTNNVFQKGVDLNVDSYSGFFDNGGQHATGLDHFLKRNGVVEIYVVGVATDYCVKHTVLDAVRLGFKTHLIEDACCGVDLNPGDVNRAIQEMRQAGAWITDSSVAFPPSLFTRQK